MRDDPAVVALVSRARDGDAEAWRGLVERYSPLLWRICQRYRLSPTQAEDVAQNVWTKLIEKIDMLRQPAALPGWLMTTTGRECLRLVQGAERTRSIERMPPLEMATDGGFDTLEWELDQEQRYIALRESFAQLPSRCQELLTLLFHDPQLSYREISRRLGIGTNAIGPGRKRCLERLRSCPAFAALIEREPRSANGGDQCDQ